MGRVAREARARRQGDTVMLRCPCGQAARCSADAACCRLRLRHERRDRSIMRPVGKLLLSGSSRDLTGRCEASLPGFPPQERRTRSLHVARVARYLQPLWEGASARCNSGVARAEQRVRHRSAASVARAALQWHTRATRRLAPGHELLVIELGSESSPRCGDGHGTRLVTSEQRDGHHSSSRRRRATATSAMAATLWRARARRPRRGLSIPTAHRERRSLRALARG